MDRPSDPLRQTALAADSDQLISTITDRPGISPLSHRPFMSEEIANKTDLVTCLLITANVGTIFEEVSSSMIRLILVLSHRKLSNMRF